jgi:hypothetical protein
MVIYGKIEDGKYHGQKPDYSKFEGKKVVIEIKEHKSTRSQMQNNYYWGVVIKYLADEIGYQSFEYEQLHEILKLKFLKPVPKIFNGIAYNIPQSTTKLNTSEFKDYIEDIRDFASKELNCYIPEPNEDIK